MSHITACRLMNNSMCEILVVQLVALSALLFCLFAANPPAFAAEATVQPTSFIAPLPRSRAYRMVVIGDSVGANLADGLRWSLRRKGKIRVKKMTKAGTGFVRTDVYNWPRMIRRLSRRRKADIIVILIGGNDRQDMRVKGRRYERFSDRWHQAYVNRLHNVAELLRASDAAVYWVGLPNVRSRRMSRDYKVFNRYYRRISKRYGFKYLESRQLFETRSGGYSDYGKDLRGRRVRLRDRDGIHMSSAGSKLLGRYVADEIMNDMPQRTSSAARVKNSTRYARKRLPELSRLPE